MNQKNDKQKHLFPAADQLRIEDIEITPDFTSYPWAGILNVMYHANRRGLDHLEQFAHEQFQKLARQEAGLKR